MSSPKTKLLIAPCSFEAAKFAVLNWHYSKTMPSGKLVKFGVWENDKFIGAVIYGRGANNNLAKSLNLKTTECCELVRVALTTHITHVTRIVAITLKLLKKLNSGLLVVASYADETNQGHKGVIYKAGNWTYRGKSISKSGHVKLGDKIVHYRSINARFKSISRIPEELRGKMQKVEPQVKHLFTYDLRR